MSSFSPPKEIIGVVSQTIKFQGDQSKTIAKKNS